MERFFRDLTEDKVREGNFRHVKVLCDQNLAYPAERNANPMRYAWNAQGEDILRKIQRAKQALPHSHFGNATLNSRSAYD